MIPVEARGAMDSGAAELLAAALRAKVVGFCRLARRHGLRVGLRETQDICRVTALFLVTDFPAFRDGLRALMCLSPEDLPVFDRLFEGYWCPADASLAIAEPSNIQEAFESFGALQVLTLGDGDRVESEGETHTLSGASALERQEPVDLSLAAAADRRALERVAQRLWNRMSVRRARRLAGWEGRRRLHVRRTWRRNLAHGGEPLRLVFSGWRPRKPRLVLLLDVSGSMELYSLLLLRLVHALQRRFRKVTSFVFSTRLVEVTPALRSRRLEEALRAVSALRLGWNGGTRIGDCLAAFGREQAGRTLRPDTVLIILSDGLDVGEPERLTRALLAVRGRVRRIVWLNPLLGIEGYQPIARGMRAALPLVDVFAPAHDLESLLGLDRLLAG
jgi:uncharacterized protein with von Willebrand factor type A (vWA) domain